MPMIGLVLALTATIDVKAQIADPLTGAVGSTTATGNGHWVSAQVAIKQGSLDAAFRAADRACQEGTAIACAFAGELIIQGQAPLATPEQSVALFQRGCDLGNANACQGFGLMLVQGIGVAADAKKGQGVMLQACQASNVMACVNLGLMFKMGLFGPPNHTEANLYFKRALVLQPDNQLALQAITESSQTALSNPSASPQPRPPARTSATTELRGRLADNPASAPASPAAPTSCWDSVSKQWNTARESNPTKPTWNPPAAAPAVTLGEAQTIGLLMLVARNSETAIPAGTQTLPVCLSFYASALKPLLSQPWIIAPDALAQNTLIQLSPPLDLTSPTATGDQTLLLMIDVGGSAPRRPPHAEKAFALFQVTCDTGEVTPQFFFQTDRQGKLQPAPGTATTAAPAAISDRARQLGCIPQSERRLWTRLSGLEAALSLRFEQDQQQTP